MNLWQSVKWFKRYMMAQPGLLLRDSKRGWWLRTRWFPLNWALTQQFNNTMKSCILAELETPQMAMSKVFINLILHQKSVNSRSWFGKWAHSNLTWSVKVKVNIWSSFTSYAKLLGTSAVGAKLYRLLVFLFRAQWFKATWLQQHKKKQHLHCRNSFSQQFAWVKTGSAMRSIPGISTASL